MPLPPDAAAERAALAARLRAMPAAMRERPQWLLWRLEEVEGRKGLQKVPYYTNGTKRRGELGSERDRARLATLDAAVQRLEATGERFTGVGFAFLEGDGLIGIDLDKTLDAETGELREAHLQVLEACASYTEWSPSGKGLHVIAQGDAVKSFKHDPIGIEVYCEGRYFTCTGNRLEAYPDEVRPLKPYALAYLRELVQASKDAAAAQRGAEEGAAAAAPSSAPVATPPAASFGAQSGDDFRRVNDEALQALSKWVPALLPKARVYQKVGYRVTSKDLGRPLEEDLQLMPGGIMDFGEEQGMSPIDVCLKWGAGLSTPLDAMRWLAGQLGLPVGKRGGLRLVRGGARAPSAPEAPEDRPEPPPDDADAEADAQGGSGGSGARKRGRRHAEGGGGAMPRLLAHYALVRGTDSVWDGEERTLMQVKNLRLLFGAPMVNTWLAHPERKLLRPEQIRFEPGEEFNDGSVNLFGGLPTKPVECTPADVKPMLDLLRHLCSLSAPTAKEREAIEQQVLQWCALMVRQPGAKMRFALVFHGPQGTGKNLFFDTFRAIFGKHGKMVGQAELEDRFNGYMSGKLLLIANEVMTRAELFHQKNKLKWVITEDEIPIRGMHQETRWESNHCNIVFLSNENMPVVVEMDDRRHLVIYTPAAEDQDLYLRVGDFLKDDGPGKWLHYLCTEVDVEGFNEYTKPLMTQAKQDLITLGMRPQQRFVAEWLEGYLDLPVMVCSVEQLFRAYTRWCETNGTRWPGEQSMFTDVVQRYVIEQREHDDQGRRLDPRLMKKVIQLKDAQDASSRRRACRCWVPRGCAPPDGATEGQWANDSIEAFEPVVRRFGRLRFDEEAQP